MSPERLMDAVLLIVLLWGGIAIAGLFFLRHFRWVSHLLFPLGAVCGLFLACFALMAIPESPVVRVLPLGLPDLPFHLRLDSLTAFFLLVLGAVTAGISTYAAGYFRQGEGTEPGLLCFFYHLFLASMALVLLADDAYLFMLAWESMALASFFLVISEHRHAEIRQAGYLYLLLAHLGAAAILLSFGVMAGHGGHYTFDAMRAVAHVGYAPTLAFLLALIGFGAKAGLLPLHVWLPEAHPAAPSPVSALMSGVMLKTAIYGLLRITFDLLEGQTWWWGALLIVVGLITALFGVVYAAIQTDMKRLLAYSSIENIGLIVVGMGLALIFKSFGMPHLSALALIALLYHCINHACFKSLLFLATGAVLHATGERNLGKLGGLIHRMPWVAWLSLIGVLASAGLPPLNGFVSEWLLLQGFLFTSGLPHGYLNMLLPVVAAAIALVAALSGFAMVKFFGVVFLGQPREEKLNEAHDAGRLERLGLLWLAAACVLLGVIPTLMVSLLDPVTHLLAGGGLLNVEGKQSWWLLAPVNAERASYSAPIFLGCLALFIPITFALVRRWFGRSSTRVPPWDCGFPLQTPRMQDTAEGFGQPIRRIFSSFMRRTRQHPSPFDAVPRYMSKVEDPIWYGLYLPILRGVEAMSRMLAFFQERRIAIYLLYTFITLLSLLLMTRG